MKTIELILCFSDKTWEYYDANISLPMWIRRDKEEVESHFTEDEPLITSGRHHPGGEVKKSIVAIMVSWWGEE